MSGKLITVLGSFIADLTFRSPELPGWGQTILGTDFQIGPGGKGSNQAIAAARLGGKAAFICKLGRDPFADLAKRTYQIEGIDSRYCYETSDAPTGAASIIVHSSHGENSIVVDPGSGLLLTYAEVDAASPLIKDSAAFVVQLELSLEIVEHGLSIARGHGVKTILNPAPAMKLPPQIYSLCDYLTPNESEASMLFGEKVESVEDAERAADYFLSQGVKNAVVTLGAKGAFVKNSRVSGHVPAFNAGAPIETTGAGDAFNGALAVAISEGLDLMEAARFGCAAAAICVTRRGTSQAMPRRDEVDALLAPA